MSGYSRIVVAVDLSSESAPIIARARDVAARGAEIHLVYVQEPMDSVYLGVVPYGPVFVGMDQVEGRLRDELTEKLRTLGREYGIPESRQHFLSGTPAKEIHRLFCRGERYQADRAGHAWSEGRATAAGRHGKFRPARRKLRRAGGAGPGALKTPAAS